MGDVGIIARRLKNGTIEYGWCGNGAYFSNTGAKLLTWYTKENMVDYLFSLGQLSLIGEPSSETKPSHWFTTHKLTGEAYNTATTERMIFSKIAFIDYGYFYDIDDKWYYIIPGPFRTKIPLYLIGNNLDDSGYEFSFLTKIQRKLINFIFNEYTKLDVGFISLLENKDVKKICKELVSSDFPIYDFYKKYNELFSYFDDWVIVLTDDEYKNIIDFKLKKATVNNNHIETIEW